MQMSAAGCTGLEMMMQRILSVVISLAIVAVAVFVGAQASDLTNKLLRLVITLPGFEPDATQIKAALVHLMVAGAALFSLATLAFKEGLFASARRTAAQVYVFGAAWGIASLYLFLMTSNVFPHQLLIGAFVATLVMLMLGYALFGQPGPRSALLPRLGAVIAQTFRLLAKPLALLAVLVTALPLLAAVAYVKSQDFRDHVAEFRVRQNAAIEGDWITVAINDKTQLLQPIMIRFEPGKPGSLLVLERAGRLYRMSYPDNGTKELLVDFSAQVGVVNLENGALGFDFDPKYQDGGRPYVYIYYTAWKPDQQVNHLSRFDLSKASAGERLASQFDLMKLGRTPDQYHNGGTVELGPDGFLWISVGEMSRPQGYQRIDDALTAGILRIDVLQQGGAVSRPITRQPAGGQTQGYYIPLDNPFADGPDSLGEYYALGLRNPFRFSIDPANGWVWAGDVGSTTWEEVNLIRKGHNYQFPYIEGKSAQQGYARPAQPLGKEAEPIYFYEHTAYDRSVIGGIVYRGDRWPQLKGKYIFGDNYSGALWAIPATGDPVQAVEVLGQATAYAQRGFTSFVQAPDGRILITLMGSSSAPNGEIVELVTRKAGAGATLAGGAASAGSAVVEVATDASVKESYLVNCARCHGDDGKGNGPDAELLKEQFGVLPTNFHSEAFRKLPDAEVYKAIKEGGAAVNKSEAMPPWDGILSEQETNSIIAYIRKLPAQ